MHTTQYKVFHRNLFRSSDKDVEFDTLIGHLQDIVLGELNYGGGGGGGGGANPKHAEICHLGMGKSGEKWGKFKTSKFMFRENF